MAKRKKVSECHEKLSRRITVANLVPPGFDLNPHKDLFAKYAFKNIEDKKRLFIEQAKLLPDEFRSYYKWIDKIINGKVANPDRFTNEERKFFSVEYREEWASFVTGGWVEFVINKSKGQTKIEPIEDPPYKVFSALQSAVVYRQSFEPYLGFDDLPDEQKALGLVSSSKNFVWLKYNNGILTPAFLNSVTEIIVSNQIDIRRLLECPVCRKIVWKKQITAETCGKQKCVQRQKYINKKKKDKKLADKKIIDNPKVLKFLDQRLKQTISEAYKGVKKKNGNL